MTATVTATQKNLVFNQMKYPNYRSNISESVRARTSE